VAPRCYRSSLIAASVPRPPRGLFEPLITHDSPLAIARDLTSLSRSPNPWRNTSWCYPSPSRSLGPATHSAFEAPAPLLASRPHLRLPRQIAHTYPNSPPTLTFCSTTEFISPEAGALLLPGAAPRPSSASSPRVACRLRLLRAPGSTAAFVCFEPPGRLPLTPRAKKERGRRTRPHPPYFPRSCPPPGGENKGPGREVFDKNPYLRNLAFRVRAHSSAG
jgi:hypothetical protein